MAAPHTKPKARSPWGAAVLAAPSLPLSTPPRIAPVETA